MLESDGELRADGVDRLVKAVGKAVRIADRHGVRELVPLATATATIRDATNAGAVRERVRHVAGVDLVSLSGENPDLAVSLPLGAGRLTRQLMPRHPARVRDVKAGAGRPFRRFGAARASVARWRGHRRYGMRTLRIDRLDVCPWALREGILLRRIDELTYPRQRHQAEVISIASTGPGARSRPAMPGALTPVVGANGRARAGVGVSGRAGRRGIR